MEHSQQALQSESPAAADPLDALEVTAPPAILRELEAKKSASKHAAADYEAASAELKTGTVEMEELSSNKKLEPEQKERLEELRPRVEELNATIDDLKQLATSTRREARKAQQRADAERMGTFAKLQSERLLQQTAACARAYTDAKAEVTQRLNDHQAELARARKAREWAARKKRHHAVDKSSVEAATSGSASVVALKEELGRNFARLSELFKKWDVDHDRSISLSELKMALAALQLQFTDEDADELFAEMDADGSGAIDSEELYEALRAYGAPRKEHPLSEAAITMPKRTEPNPAGSAEEQKALHALKKALSANMTRVTDLLHKWDVDGDGQISVSELQRALAGLCIAIDKKAVQRLFASVDVDGSGNIDFGELKALLKKDAGEEDIVDLAQHGPRRSLVRELRPQSSPAGLFTSEHGSALTGGASTRRQAAMHRPPSRPATALEPGRRGAPRPASRAGGGAAAARGQSASTLPTLGKGASSGQRPAYSTGRL